MSYNFETSEQRCARLVVELRNAEIGRAQAERETLMLRSQFENDRVEAERKTSLLHKRFVMEEQSSTVVAIVAKLVQEHRRLSEQNHELIEERMIARKILASDERGKLKRLRDVFYV